MPVLMPLRACHRGRTTLMVNVPINKRTAGWHTGLRCFHALDSGQADVAFGYFAFRTQMA